MGRTLLLGVLIGCLLCTDMITAARGGRGGKGRGVGRKGYSSRMPVLIQHRNPASASYYNHKDDDRIEGGYEAVPTRDIHMKQVGLKKQWDYFLEEFVGPLQQRVFIGYVSGAKIVNSSHFELDYMLGRKITFFCMAQGQPRPHITWFKEGIELYAHQFFQVHEWTIGDDTLKSKMEIDPTAQKDAGYYECQADNKYAIDRRGFRTDYVMYTY